MNPHLLSSMHASGVSVIIPAHNAERFQSQALDSVFRQTLIPTEVIVVDDGSTDGTSVAAQRYADRIQYIHQENQGPSAARNTGIRHSTGNLIAFLDADDLWQPRKLEIQCSHLHDHPEYAAVYTDITEIDAGGGILQVSKFAGVPGAGREGWILEDIILHGFIFTPTVLMRRHVFKAIGLFDETLPSSEDRDLFIRMASMFQIGCVTLPLAMRRRHDTNISNDFMDRMLRTDCLVLERALENIHLTRELTKKARRRVGQLYARLARHDLGKGRRELARAELLRSFSMTNFPMWEVLLLLPLTVAPRSVLTGLHHLKHCPFMSHPQRDGLARNA